MAKNDIRVEDLPLALRRGIEGKGNMVPGKLVTVGRLLTLLEGMPRAEALWALRTTIRMLGGK